MWTLENSDMVLNTLKANIEPEHFVSTALRFAVFVGKVDGHHPCGMPFPATSRIIYSDGDDYAIHLSGGWWITYRVLPDCSAANGIVRFIDVNRLGSLAISPTGSQETQRD